MKFALQKAMMAQKVSTVQSYLSLTSALAGDEWVKPRHDRFNPGKDTR